MDQKQDEVHGNRYSQYRSVYFYFSSSKCYEMRDGEYLSFLMFVAVNLSFHSQFKKDSRR